jgi:hypothetical protein
MYLIKIHKYILKIKIHKIKELKKNLILIKIVLSAHVAPLPNSLLKLPQKKQKYNKFTAKIKIIKFNNVKNYSEVNKNHPIIIKDNLSNLDPN